MTWQGEEFKGKPGITMAESQPCWRMLPRRKAVMLQLKRVDASIARSFVGTKDRQGIGLTLDVEDFTDTLDHEPSH